MSSQDQQDLSSAVRDLRNALGLSQSKLAERLQVSNPTVARWEQGRSSPTDGALSDLLALAREADAELIEAVFNAERLQRGMPDDQSGQRRVSLSPVPKSDEEMAVVKAILLLMRTRADDVARGAFDDVYDQLVDGWGRFKARVEGYKPLPPTYMPHPHDVNQLGRELISTNKRMVDKLYERSIKKR